LVLGGLGLNIELDYGKLGERLKEARIKKHMTQEELSEKIDSATSSISHLENGTHSPSLKTLIKICNVLEIGIDSLLCDSLPAISSSYLDKDFEKLLADCTVQEKQLLFKISEAAKKTIREQK
jgi:transcriptional regulator with XRE-family HTH domain